MYRLTSRFLQVALLLAVLTIVLASPARLQAQEDLQLRLSTESETPADPPTLGEFPISLDSEVLTPERRFSLIADEFQPASYRVGDNRLVLRGDPWGNTNPAKDGPAGAATSWRTRTPAPSLGGGGTRVPNDRYLKDFSPTLTWTAPYLQTSSGLAARSGQPALGARRRIGRWAVYGEFAREAVPQLGLSSPEKTSIPLPTRVANKSVFSGNTRDTGTRPLDPRPPEESHAAIALDNYYLEAIYNILPSFQGKVSYNRAIAETRDQKEKIQVEGIVEAGKDVVIKAGFRNESVPELKSNRNANDTKVWTEFILKF